MDAVIYLRISSDRTGQQAGAARQREQCERRCAERGWTVIAVESDNDQSAATGSRKRPGFEAMLDHVANGRAQVVVAWSLDRLQRNRRDELRLWETCQATNARISLINGADLDLSTAGGRLVADQLSSVARYEVELKSDRQKAAQEQAAKAGRRVGGRRPFGYEADGMTVRPAEAEAIRQGYADLLSRVPLGEIARRWTAAGLTTGQCGWKGDRKGVPSPFTRSAVRDVLANPRNAALRFYRGERIAEATWPRIVDETTWQAAVDLLTDAKRRTSPTGNARALLTGVALCAACGETVHAGGATRAQQYRVYRCRSMRHIARRAEPVDAFVSALAVARLQRPDAYDLLHDTTKPDADLLRIEASALRVRLDTLAVAFAEGDVDASQLREGTARLRENLAVVEARISDAGRVDVLGPLVHAADVQAAWDGLSVARRRAVVDTLMVVRIRSAGRGTRTFDPESVEVEWR